MTNTALFKCRNTACNYEGPYWGVKPCPRCKRFYNYRPTDPGGQLDDGDEIADGQVVSFAAVAKMLAESGEESHIPTGIKGLDYVLGGGIAPDLVALLTGDPSAGKTTLLRRIGHALAKKGHRVLYITGEESVKQIVRRAIETKTVHAKLLGAQETELDSIMELIEEREPFLTIIDSVQTLMVPNDRDDAKEPFYVPGGMQAITKAIREITKLSKRLGVAIILVGHIDKQGAISGPRTLEYLVDAIFHLKKDPRTTKENDTGLRGFSCPGKNRFGEAPRETWFKMTDKGLVDADPPPREEAWAYEEDEGGEEPAPRAARALRPKRGSKKTAAAAPSPPAPPPPLPPPPSSTGKKPRLRSVPMPPTAPPAPPAPDAPADWVSADGVPADKVLEVSCNVDGCKGSKNRACSSSSGVREAGFHTSRVAKAKLGDKTTVVHEEAPDEQMPPDPFSKKFGAPPRLKPAKATKPSKKPKKKS